MSVIKEGEDLSVNEKTFILSALKEANIRMDGRTVNDTRPLRITYSRSEGQASSEVQLGRTRVLCVVTAEVVPPYADRPTEGFLMINVELSPMAAPNTDSSRSSPVVVEVDRIIDRSIRDSHALDTEALCIVVGQKVWSLRCDIHILDDSGNVIDTAALATMSALHHFRLPEVTVTDSGGVIVHHSFDREPSPLPIPHTPICVTFGLFDEGSIAVMDPTHREEAVMGGRITYALNIHKEICALHKIGGVPMTASGIIKCIAVAHNKVNEWHTALQDSLTAADEKAKAERLERVRGTASVDNWVTTAAPPPGGADIMEGVGVEHIKHLDFAELHVTMGLRQDKEVVEKPADQMKLLEKAAQETEEYHQQQQEHGKAVVHEASRPSSLTSTAPRATNGAGEDEDVTKSGPLPPPPPAKDGDNMDVGGSDSEEEGGEAGVPQVLYSEFHKQVSVPQAGGGGGVTRRGAVKPVGSKLLGQREGDDEDEEGDGDLVAAVKKPGKRSRSGGGRGMGKARGGGRAR